MKIVKRIIIGIIIVLLVIIGGVYFFTKSTLPDYTGTITTEKIENKVEIIRDSYGVPHIFAENQNDLAFGLGYAMAQDRLWQMDILRRASLGRLSELFGTTVRYSGVSIGYQLASILAGGLAPIIAVALLGAFQSGYAIAVYVALAALITVVAVGTYSETNKRDLAADPKLTRV